MLSLRNIWQHGSDLNANVTYAVLITVKQNHYPTNSKHFHASILTFYCVMLRSSIITELLCIYYYYYYNYYLARI